MSAWRVCSGIALGMLAICGVAPVVHTQHSTTPTFNGTIAVPLDLKSLDHDVHNVRLVCRVQPPNGAWDEGVVWGAPYATGTAGNPALGNVSNFGSYEGTLTVYFTATRTTPFTQGEIWSYSCGVKLIRQPAGTSVAETADPGTGLSVATWAQVALGTTTVQGSFVLR